MKIKFIYLFISVFLFCKCSSSKQDIAAISDFENIDLSLPFQKADPADVGMGDLNSTIQKAKQNSRLTSLIVIKNGKLVLEEYFNGNHADSLNDVRSITKSVVSALLGIAIEEGFIGNIDQTIGEILTKSKLGLTDKQKSITIRDMLTMTSGIEWDETTASSYNDWILSQDHIGYLLEQPFDADPGTKFTYNSALTHFLGVLLDEATGMKLQDFANQHLFSKMKIKAAWEDLGGEYVNGGAGIDLKPIDIAKFGQLFLQNGKSGDTQIIPEEWVLRSTTPAFSWKADLAALKNYTYGFLWWVVDSVDDAYLAWGYAGQFIYVIPNKNMVIVTTNNWINARSDGGPREIEKASLDIIVNEILSKVD